MSDLWAPWLVFGAITIVGGLAMVLMALDEDNRRMRKAGYRTILAGLLLPIAVPFLIVLGIRYAIADYRRIVILDREEELEASRQRVAELERELGIGGRR